MKKTFSAEVKIEIAEYDRDHEDSVLFLFALIKSNGTLKKGKISIKILSEELRKLIMKEINKTFKTRVTEKGNTILINPDSLGEDFDLELSSIELFDDEDLKTFLTGIFVGKGYVNSPVSKYYHLEIRVKKLMDAINITELMKDIEIKAKFILKNGWYYVYVKRSMDISDLLAAFKSPTYSMIFTDQTIQRNFSAAISRSNAIDVYNQSKIAEASLGQCKASKICLSDKLKYRLSIQEIRIANLRLEFPEYSSYDLSVEYNIKYHDDKSKPTINRWLNRIISEVKLHE